MSQDEYREPEDYDRPRYGADHGRRYPRRRRGGLGRFFRGILLLVIGTAVGASAINYLAKNPNTLTGFFQFVQRNKEPQASPALAGKPEVPPTIQAEPIEIAKDNLIALQAQQWGIKECLGKVVDLSGFLTRGVQSAWMMKRGMQNADQQLLSGTVVAREAATGVRAVHQFFAAPVSGGACDSSYVSTIYFPENCSAAKARFPDFNVALQLGDIAPGFTNAATTGTIVLLTAGLVGCVVVKSESAY